MRRPEAPPPSTYQPSPPAVDKGEKDGDKKEKKAALMQWNNLVADDWRTDTAPASTYIPSPPEVEAPASLAQEDDKKLTKKDAKLMLEKAELSYEDKNYIDALDKFIQLYEYKPSDLYYKLMMGICYTYDPDQKQKSIEIIEQVKITNPEHNLINYHLGRAYAVNYEFDKAVNLFNMFVARATKEDVDQKNMATQMIVIFVGNYNIII